MKIPQIVVFLSIVLGIYFLVNSFIYVQSRPLFNISGIGVWIKVLFWVLVLSYPLGRVLEGIFNVNLFTLFIKAGSIWLGAMLYLFLAFLVLWLLKITNNLINVTEFLDFKNHQNYHQVAVISIYAIASIVLLAGHINAINPTVNKIHIKTDKPIQNGELKVVAISDIHLGTIIGKKDLSKLVRMVNNQHPDIVLLVGDIFDEDIAPVVNGQMGKLFEEIKSKYGIYAVTGNHEFFGKYDQKIAYLQQHGIKMLSDTAIVVDNYNIVGRNDRQSNHVLNHPRKPLSEIVASIDKGKFTILMDHQPYNLDEAKDNGIDLQLSGHTHHGQLWPFNYITKGIFEVSSGYYKKGNTNYYVSTGFGTWGPRVRTGNRPEIVVIEVNH